MKIAVLFKSNCLGFIIDTQFKMLGHNLVIRLLILVSVIIIVFLVASGHPTSDQRGDNLCPKTDFLAGQMQ